MSYPECLRAAGCYGSVSPHAEAFKMVAWVRGGGLKVGAKCGRFLPCRA